MSAFKDIVVCKFAGCNQVFNDPRILPCGNRTCAAHIEMMTLKSEGSNNNSDRKMLKCHFCEEIHIFPDNGKGFLVDRNIPLLLNIKYSKEHCVAKEKFNEVTQLIDKLIKIDQDGFVIHYFERMEEDILVEKEVNM